MPSENSNEGAFDASTPLLSEYAGDADMAELIDFFVNELGDRIAGLEAAFGGADERRLREIAHQLKGAAACYGYQSITDSAAALELAMMAEQAELSDLAEQVEDLIGLCRRAAASASNS